MATFRRGTSGITHCGSWTPVRPGERYGWTTRLVCVLLPKHEGPHKSTGGYTWETAAQAGGEP